MARKNKILGLIYSLVDLLITVLGIRLAYALRFSPGMMQLFPPPHPNELPPLENFFNLPIIGIVCLVWLVVFRFNGLHLPRRWRSPLNLALSIFSSVTLGTTALVGIAFFYREMSYSRIVVGTFWVLDFLLILLARLAIRGVILHLRRRGFNQRRVLVAGTGALGRTLVERIGNHPGLGLEIVGFLATPKNRDAKQVKRLPVLGTTDQAPEVIRDYQVNDVYVALPLQEHQEMYRLLGLIQNECVAVKVIPDVLQYITIMAGVEDFDGIPVINLSEIPLSGWNSLIKRAVDVSLSLVGLILTAPLTLLVALGVKLTSPGPILYTQERMGLDGTAFPMLKFRSMRVDAEEGIGPTMATERDPRCTPFGSFIRAWSLDELPQLLNVLRGDMSLVGPRPERPSFVDEFRQKIPRYMLRHRVRSGMTGWAQVNGLRGNTSIKERIDYDIYYIENWSLTLDFKIMLLTMFHLRRNAV